VSHSVGQPDGWAELQLFLTDEEQFANLQLWKSLSWVDWEQLGDEKMRTSV
jgi:hypothetical protein